MSEKNEIALIKEINEIVKNEEKNSKRILSKIEKMQEFHEINDMTNTIFEIRLANIEDKLEKIIKMYKSDLLN